MFRPLRAAGGLVEHTSQYGSVSSTKVPSWPLVGAGVFADDAGRPHSGTLPYTDDAGPHNTP